ncbi:myosin light chain kinase A-like [Penaeus indicus]|uniref:myosin light chain kinase A-like n=1 Tax=Penaeus indicus TaxID=29960 RepID=UPI00300CA51E
MVIDFCKRQNLPIFNSKEINELFGNSPIVLLGKGAYGTCYLVKDKELSGSLSDTTKLKVIYSFALAVRNIISGGYVHNDLHSSNICMKFEDDEPVVTIIDFGIATKIGEYMCYEEVPGIGLHLAPELYEGCGQGETTEVFSVAVFIEDVYPTSVPDLLKAWVTGAKSKCPEERPTINDLIEILMRVLED